MKRERETLAPLEKALNTYIQQISSEPVRSRELVRWPSRTVAMERPC